MILSPPPRDREFSAISWAKWFANLFEARKGDVAQDFSAKNLTVAGTFTATGTTTLATSLTGALRADAGVVSVLVTSVIRVNTSNGYGSTNTGIRRFLNTVTNVGDAITYADSATLGGTFTINITGTYAISYSDSFSTAHDFGVSLNSTQLATAFALIAVADRLNHGTTASPLFALTVSATLRLTAGDVIRGHAGGLGGGTADRAHFIISRVN